MLQSAGSGCNLMKPTGQCRNQPESDSVGLVDRHSPLAVSTVGILPGPAPRRPLLRADSAGMLLSSRLVPWIPPPWLPERGFRHVSAWACAPIVALPTRSTL